MSAGVQDWLGLSAEASAARGYREGQADPDRMRPKAIGRQISQGRALGFGGRFPTMVIQ